MSAHVAGDGMRLTPVIRRAGWSLHRISASVNRRRPSADHSLRSQPLQSVSATSRRTPSATSSRSTSRPSPASAVRLTPPASASGRTQTSVRSSRSAVSLISSEADGSSCSSQSCQQPSQGRQRASRSPAAPAATGAGPRTAAGTFGGVWSDGCMTQSTSPVASPETIAIMTSLPCCALHGRLLQKMNRMPAPIRMPDRSRSSKPSNAPAGSAAART